MASRNHIENKKIFVLVPGLPGWGLTDQFYWDTLTFDSQWIREMNAKLFLVSPGPMSSHHDRACEVFGQLMGRLTDFGEEHSKSYEHCRYGRNFTNQHNISNEWNEDKPINFICHCSGTNTIRYLQYLLSIDFWNIGTTANWINMIVSINGNINGTQFMHFLNIDPVTGYADRNTLIKSSKEVYNSAQWAINRKKDVTHDQKSKVSQWYLEHWGIDCTAKKWLSDFSKNTKFLTNKDDLFYDLTIHGCIELNKLITTNPDTYYISLYAQATDLDKAIQISPQINPIFLKPSTYILFSSCTKGLLNNKLYRTTEWKNNDGIYSVACQKYPLNTEITKKIDKLTKIVNIDKGCWYYGDLQEIIGCTNIIDHFSIIWARNFLKPSAFQLSAQEQKNFYMTLMEFLIKLN